MALVARAFLHIVIVFAFTSYDRTALLAGIAVPFDQYPMLVDVDVGLSVSTMPAIEMAGVTKKSFQVFNGGTMLLITGLPETVVPVKPTCRIWPVTLVLEPFERSIDTG